MRWLAASGLAVDAVGVDLEQDGDAVAGAAGDLGGGDPGVDPQGHGSVAEVRCSEHVFGHPLLDHPEHAAHIKRGYAIRRLCAGQPSTSDELPRSRQTRHERP